jgi:hypothetical protein
MPKVKVVYRERTHRFMWVFMRIFAPFVLLHLKRILPVQARRGLNQPMLLQFLAQRIAINAQHFRCLRLVAVRACHHGLKNWLFHRKNDHLVYIRRLLLAQILKIFFQAFFNDVLNAVFAHAVP